MPISAVCAAIWACPYSGIAVPAGFVRQPGGFKYRRIAADKPFAADSPQVLQHVDAALNVRLCHVGCRRQASPHRR
jgi:hypothetical protein